MPLMRIHRVLLASLLAGASLAAGCGGSGASKCTTACGGEVDTRPLFDRLGGIPAITAVVEEFVVVTGNDPRIAQFFTNIDVPRLKQLMVDHICELTGGPCTYAGRSMKESHLGMKVRVEHFEAFMEDLGLVLDKLAVPARERGEVIGAFEALRADVIEPA